MISKNTNNQNKEIGKRIKIIRVSLGKDLDNFGKMLSQPASASLVSRWERGVNKPNNKRLRSIAKLGNVSVEYLLTGESFLPKYTAGEILNRLNPKEFEQFINETSNELEDENISIKRLNEMEKQIKNDGFDSLSKKEQQAINEENFNFKIFLKDREREQLTRITNAFSLENIEKIFSTSSDLVGLMDTVSTFISSFENNKFNKLDSNILMNLETLLGTLGMLIRDKNEDGKKIFADELNNVIKNLDKKIKW